MVTIELTPEEANVLLKLMTTGFNKVKGQNYVITKYQGRVMASDFMASAFSCVAKVQAQVALQK